MQTTCPECRTVFLVSQDQLGLRRGLVRCGKCDAVFNAYDTLLAELRDAPETTPVPAAPAHDALADPETAWAAYEPPALAAQPDRVEVKTLKPEEPAPAETEAAPAAEAAAPSAQVEAETPPAETSDSILLSELPHRKPAVASTGRGKAVLFGLLGGLLVLLLFAQLAYFLRAPLVAAWPASRPALEGACRLLGCDVPLPRQLGREAIAAANLEHDPEQKSRVRLTFLLANRSGQTQAWPHISLTLTDVREQPVAMKLFAPASYLPAQTKIAAGMASGEEKEARLELDIGNLAATGFALSPVYP